jgi:hypothetical protein
MPLYWTIDSKERFVTVTSEGGVTRADADRYLDAVDGGRAVAYRKLFDGRSGTVAMDHDDLMAIGARFRSYHDRPVGALAIVLTEEGAASVARILGILASADRPMRLFTSLPAAERWIGSQAP